MDEDYLLEHQREVDLKILIELLDFVVFSYMELYKRNFTLIQKINRFEVELIMVEILFKTVEVLVKGTKRVGDEVTVAAFTHY